MIEFLKNNYEWLFGGVTILLGIISLFIRKPGENSIKQKQKSGNNSTNIQVGQINQKK